VIVVDASVLAAALGDDGSDGQRARDSFVGEDLFAPELIDLEVASVWRRATRTGQLSQRRVHKALADLAELPLTRAPHGPLLGRVWELRTKLTPYDAVYIALAEALDVSLVTADRRLARAPGIRCETKLLS
jgi:predicted nucleic acid-binding protein